MLKTTILTALVASANGMMNYGDMIARRTITPAPAPTDMSIDDLQKRVDTASLEGYTSEFGTWTAVYCPEGSTFKTFSTVSQPNVFAACCPLTGTCNFVYDCFAGEQADLWNGDAETCTDTCDTGYIYRSIGDQTPMIMPGCWEAFTLYRHPNGPVAGSPSTITDASSPSSVDSSESSNSTTTSSSTSKNSGLSHSTLIAVIAVIAGVVFIAVCGGLVAYICVLRRRAGNNNANKVNSPDQTATASATELNKLQITSSTAPATPVGPQPWQGKVELPTDFTGYVAYEMPSSPAVAHANVYGTPGQQPGMFHGQQNPHGGWSPHTPNQSFPFTPQAQQHHTPGVSPVSGYATPLEMPARQSGKWGSYQELPG